MNHAPVSAASASYLREVSWTLGFCGVAALLVPVAARFGPVAALAVLVGLVGSVVIMVRPFVGVVLLVFLVQLLGLVFELGGPVGQYLYEALSVLTLLAITVQAPLRPRAGRWGGKSPVFGLAVLFALSTCLSVVFSDFPEASLQELFKLCSLLVVLFVIVVTTNSTRRALVLALALLLSTAISASISLVGYLSGRAILGDAERMRFTGASSTDPTTTANVMLVGTMLAIFLLLRLAKFRPFSGVASVLGACGIVLSYSRSAMLFFIAGCGWLAFLLRKSRYAVAGMLFAVVVAIAVLPVLPPTVWERFSQLTNPSEDWTLGRRWGYHVIGFNLLADDPVLGIGPGAFEKHYATFAYRWEEGRRQEARDLHNLYLATAVEHGLVGFALFTGMLVVVVLGLRRVSHGSRDPTLAILAEGMLLAYGTFLVAAVTLPALSNKMLWVGLGLGTAITNIGNRVEALGAVRTVRIT